MRRHNDARPCRQRRDALRLERSACTRGCQRVHWARRASQPLSHACLIAVCLFCLRAAGGGARRCVRRACGAEGEPRAAREGGAGAAGADGRDEARALAGTDPCATAVTADLIPRATAVTADLIPRATAVTAGLALQLIDLRNGELEEIAQLQALPSASASTALTPGTLSTSSTLRCRVTSPADRASRCALRAGGAGGAALRRDGRARVAPDGGGGALSQRPLRPVPA